ncbi:hypothetical protein TSUD_373290 [Trifolium subterraneum]|uniref:Uncharacterized protein n=1 Tax=Trifolium subterraneum TaxID=3900 RepID=A0A2Z6NIC2_TRISU|nr:hypothetical protein TSUD_373290 [Trifolium subterraneum]
MWLRLLRNMRYCYNRNTLAVTQKDDDLKIVAEGKPPTTEVPEVENEHMIDDIVRPTPNS